MLLDSTYRWLNKRWKQKKTPRLVQERISVRDLVEVEGVPNNPLYYLYDGRGSVTQLTNSVGNVRDKYRYTPFGVPMSGGKLSPNTKLLNNPYGYNGEYYDLESGFQYLRARYYNPETARFITRDSYLGDINESLSLNRYAYTENNPVMNIDPSGHKPINAYDDYGSSIPKVTPKKAATNNQPTLRKGSTDSKGVTKLQQMMVTLGYNLKIDGKFGDKTKAAVIDFQKKNKLSQDGIVGTNTWTALNIVYGNATNTGINPGAIGMTITSNNYVSKKEKQKTSYNNKWCGVEEKISASTQGTDNSNVVQANSLPVKGVPNSTGRLYNPDGSVKQERKYGPDGRAEKDTDYNHSGEDNHEFPHEHEWDWNKTPPRQPGVPVPKPNPSNNQSSLTITGNDVGNAVVGTGIGTAIYWTVSEALRILFPPRNLVPVP